MRILVLCLIFYTVPFSEQKPFDNNNNTATDKVDSVIPIDSNLDNGNQQLSSTINDDEESTRQTDNTSVTTELTHIFKIPLVKASESIPASTVLTTLNDTNEEKQKLLSDDNQLKATEKWSETVSGATKDFITLESDIEQIDSTGSLITSTLSSTGNISNDGLTHVKRDPNLNSNSTVEAVTISVSNLTNSFNDGMEIDHTLSTSSEVEETSIASVVQELSDLNIVPVIPLEEENQSGDFKSVSETSNITLLPDSNNYTQQLAADNIEYDNVSSTEITVANDTAEVASPVVSQDNLETSGIIPSSVQHEQQSVTVDRLSGASDLDNLKNTNNSISLVSANSDPSELLIAEESSSNGTSESNNGLNSSRESGTMKHSKDVEDLNSTDVKSSTTATVTDTQDPENSTETAFLATTVQESFNISTEYDIYVDLAAESTSSTSTTESSSLKTEMLQTELLIQDLLDPTIVLAKRSIQNSDDIGKPLDIVAHVNKYRENQSSQKLKAIASSASNTWGLFLLILLLGYALVEVPRGLWNASKPGYTLHYSYFKAAKLSLDKCEAEETVDDVLESLQAASIAIGVGHPFHRNLETIFQKVPAELKDRMNRRQLPDDTPTDSPSEKALIRLHKHTIKSLQTLQRTETQWGILIENIFHLEDVAKNQASHDRRFKPTFPVTRAFPLRLIYNPTVEWYWKCVIKSYAQKLAAFAAGVLSVAVVWSEVTFFNESPVLSLFAQFVNLAKLQYDYFTIEILSTLIIAYLCYCAYSTVLKIRVLSLYYLAPHHQTNEYSLIFSGMMLCRLTPPMCLNFLGLIQMDSHIIKIHMMETHYTQVMGHMDVISIISDGFNVYFPMAILAFCLATYFSLGSRLLSMLGFQQFLGDDELTTDLVEEGRELIKRERRKRQRAEDSMSRRREFQERFNNLGTASQYRTARQSTDTVRPLRRDESTESARAGLLRDVESTDYYVGTPFENDRYIPNNHYDQGYQAEIYHDLSSDNLTTYTTNSNRVGPPPRGLFDDI